ncbi:hypothetical protein LC593_34695 [Nostoc sp. CHAB 5844]|nr:hypothetical protein [Nostoc sp. CHAB 5844]
MQKINKYVFLSLTTVGLSVGYSSLFTTEINLLAQSQTIPNVHEYLEKNKPESYKFLKKHLDASIQEAKKPSADKVVNNLWALLNTNPKIKTRERNSNRTYATGTKVLMRLRRKIDNRKL